MKYNIFQEDEIFSCSRLVIFQNLNIRYSYKPFNCKDILILVMYNERGKFKLYIIIDTYRKLIKLTLT